MSAQAKRTGPDGMASSGAAAVAAAVPVTANQATSSGADAVAAKEPVPADQAAFSGDVPPSRAAAVAAEHEKGADSDTQSVAGDSIHGSDAELE